MEGRKKTFPSTELAFYQKRKKKKKREKTREKEKDRCRRRKKKVAGGKTQRTHLALREFAFFSSCLMRHSTCASGVGIPGCLVSYPLHSIISRRGRGAGSVRAYRPTLLFSLHPSITRAVVGNEDGEWEGRKNEIKILKNRTYAPHVS